MYLDYFKTIDKTRSFYQLLILKEVFNSTLRKEFVLKGINAAHFAYSYNKTDELIQIITLEQILPAQFEVIIQKVLKKYSNIYLRRKFEKRFTMLYELAIIENSEITEEIKIVLEITKIKYEWKKNINYEIKILNIKEWNIKVVAQVMLLNEIINDIEVTQSLTNGINE